MRDKFFFYRLPGLESSKLNKEAEDLFYNKMMLTLLRMVTRPLLFCDGANSTVTETEDDDTTHGHWRAVGSSGDANLNSSMVWKNIFKWKIFTSKNRSKVYAFNEASLVDESLSPS